MEPTLHCARPGAGCLAAHEDRVVTAVRVPRRGDIVVFRTPPLARLRCGVGGLFVKRIVALPGERWSERGGRIIVRGSPLREPYVRAGRRDDLSFSGGRVPADRYVLLGDNRTSSCDSREWGTVPRRSIVGVVIEIDRGPRSIRLP